MMGWTRTFAAALTLFTLPVTIAWSQTGQTGPTGDLSVVGEVSVNGTSAISGATVFSDSTVTTAKGSSAVVSLGKLGRVEVLPQSKVKLNFDNRSQSQSISAKVEAGSVRLIPGARVGAVATTRNGKIIANDGQRSDFIVDTSCGDTFVIVKSGRVELRAGNTVKQIAAGGQDTAGQARPGCKR